MINVTRIEKIEYFYYENMDFNVCMCLVWCNSTYDNYVMYGMFNKQDLIQQAYHNSDCFGFYILYILTKVRPFYNEKLWDLKMNVFKFYSGSSYNTVQKTSLYRKHTKVQIK